MEYDSYIDIGVEPEDLWDYLQENITEIVMEPVIIAENWFEGSLIQVSVNDIRKKDFYLTVFVEGMPVDECSIYGKDTATQFYQEYIDTYIADPEMDYGSMDEERAQMFEEDAITERDNELDIAFEDLLLTVWEKTPTNDEVIDVKKKVLKLLSEEFPDKSIYRPLYLTDEKGNTVFDEYPYETWDIDE